MASRFTELAIDCADPQELASFWCAVLGYRVQSAEDGLVTIGASDSSPVVTFARVPEAKSVKNRVHLDLTPTDCSQEAEVQRLLALGARRIGVGQGDESWVVLADPEGNEFCVLAGSVTR